MAEAATCSCGDPSRPNINHRKRIPCWTYIGDNRHDICSGCGLASVCLCTVLLCMEKSRKCWGKVGRYSFDMDLPVVTLCEGHLWELTDPRTPLEKATIAEAIGEGLND